MALPLYSRADARAARCPLEPTQRRKSTVSQQDKSLFTNFVAVLGFLVVLAFVFYFIAQNVVNGGESGENATRLTMSP